jgi:DNA replication regulator DPB11
MTVNAVDDNCTLRHNGANSTVATTERPLAGAVICCTSIAPEVRSQLAEWVLQMGAEHRLDLTSDVTHLLVAHTDTPKYKYVARERDDVTVLRPTWVDAVRECWMDARPIDMNALTAEHRLPIFEGLKICVTGFDDLHLRAGMQQNVIQNGGQYSGDLTKDVTHLIANKPEGKKYEYATQWKQKVVSLQWYADTLKRGMQLDESFYHPTRPITEQGVGAWNRKVQSQTQSLKRAPEESSAPERSRKLRRTASSRLSSQSENIWSDIVGGGFKTSDVERPQVRSVKSMPAFDAQDDSQDTQPHIIAISEGYLDRRHFTIQLFDQRKKEMLEKILLERGGMVFESLQQAQDAAADSEQIMIVPHTTPATHMQQLIDSRSSLTIVSEFWLEYCMFQKRFVEPELYPLCTMLSQAKLAGFSKLRINATGFSGIQALHISKLVNMLGGQYQESFTPEVSALICSNTNDSSQKLYHARKWNVPVVSLSWLIWCLRDGRLASYEKHSMLQQSRATTDLGRDIVKPVSKDRKIRESDRFPGSDFLVHHASRDDHESKPTVADAADDHSNHRDTVLQEISSNSPPKSLPTTTSTKPKKRLFQTLDAPPFPPQAEVDNYTSSLPPQTDGTTAAPAPPTNDIANEIRDFYNLKAKSSHSSKPGSFPEARKLQGRALSNLSNGSGRRSRASSIDSINTDGVGSEIALSEKDKSQEVSITGRAKARLGPSEPIGIASTEPGGGLGLGIGNSGLLNVDEYVPEEVPLQMTQLRYDESEETTALREKLAARRRARSGVGQKDGSPEPGAGDAGEKSRKIRDDDLTSNPGWGGGRRTRQKTSPKGLKGF